MTATHLTGGLWGLGQTVAIDPVSITHKNDGTANLRICSWPQRVRPKDPFEEEAYKPSSQQVFWHSGFFFFASFLQFFLHFFMDFFSHFLISLGVILHFFFVLSARPGQLTSGGSEGLGGGGGGDVGGGEGDCGGGDGGGSGGDDGDGLDEGGARGGGGDGGGSGGDDGDGLDVGAGGGGGGGDVGGMNPTRSQAIEG